MQSSFRLTHSRGRTARALLAVTGALLLAAPVAAQDPTPPGVTIGLRYDPGSRPGVLVLPVTGATGDSVRAILMRDFDFSNRFAVIGDWRQPGEAPVPVGAPANYPLYQRLSATVVIQPSVTASGLTVSMHDVAKQSVARTRAYPLPTPANSPAWRMALHAVADDLESWITGQPGIAATQIAYSRGGRIYVTHSDGAVTQAVTDGNGTAMMPAWHPSGRQLAYAVMGDAGTQVFIRDLASGAVRRVSATTGANVTPSFSPDGQTLFYAYAEESGMDIYAVPLGSGARRRVTVGRGTDNLSPTSSPDGRRIAFTSARSGKPQVWATDVDGGDPELLTPFNYGDQGERTNPNWSPDGRRIAFQSLVRGQYQIMTLTVRDRNVRQHTDVGVNEDPAWAPDGRHVVFSSTRGGSQQIWILDTESGASRQLTSGGGKTRMAAWSARLGTPAAP